MEVAPPAAHSPARARWTLGVLFLLFLAAASLRLVGIDFQLPHSQEPDAWNLDGQVLELQGQPDSRLGTQLYPFLLGRLAAPWVAPARAPEHPVVLEEHIERAAQLRRELRRVVALFSSLIVPVTWLVARRFLPAPWALVAAAIQAVSLLSVWFTQQARPHGPHAVLALLAVAAAMRVGRRGDAVSLACAGLCSGLAMSTLQFGAATLFPLCFAVLVRLRARERVSLVGVVLAVLALATCVAVSYPHLWRTPAPGLQGQIGFDGKNLEIGGGHVPLDLDGQGFVRMGRALGSYEPVLSGMLLVALVFLLRRWWTARAGRVAGALPLQRDLLILLAHALPLFVLFGLFQRTYARFVLALLPYVAILCAYGLWRLWGALERRGKRELATALVVLALALEATASVQLVRLRARPDTEELASDWIRTHVDAGETIAVMPLFDPLVFQDDASLARNKGKIAGAWMMWLDWQVRTPSSCKPGKHYSVRSFIEPDMFEALKRDPAAFVARFDAEWAVTSPWRQIKLPRIDELRKGVARLGEHMIRFAPEPDGTSEAVFDNQDDYSRDSSFWFARVFAAERVGPVVDIWRMKPR